MARLLHTNDPYTNYSSYPTIDTVMSGAVYDPTHTSYNITLRNTPFCFFFDNVDEIFIQDNSGTFSIDLTSSDSNFACTSIPVIGQTTELIIQDTDIGYIQVAPESVVNALYNVESPDCDGDPTFCVDVEEVETFCAIMTTPGTGGESIPACIVQQKTGTIALTDVTLTTQEKENIFEGFDDILISILMLVFMVFFAVFVKKLLSYFWR